MSMKNPYEDLIQIIDVILRKIDKLYDDKIDGRISADFYDKKLQ